MIASSGLTVGALLHGRPKAIGLALDLLAGATGLERRITSLYIQKTGLAPGRNLAILVEVTARNQLLRSRGHHVTHRLATRVDRQLRCRGSVTQPAASEEALGPGARR